MEMSEDMLQQLYQADMQHQMTPEQIQQYQQMQLQAQLEQQQQIDPQQFQQMPADQMSYQQQMEQQQQIDPQQFQQMPADQMAYQQQMEYQQPQGHEQPMDYQQQEYQQAPVEHQMGQPMDSEQTQNAEQQQEEAEDPPQMSVEMQQQMFQQLQQIFPPEVVQQMTPETMKQQIQALFLQHMANQFQQMQQLQQQMQQPPAPPADDAKASQDSGGEQSNVNPLTGQSYTPRFYYLLDKRQRLPAWTARQDLLKLMQLTQVVVLVAEPGSGKTTQIPQILLDAGYHVQAGQVKAIACVQPNTLAAVSASQRVCEELEVQVGTYVGHVTRFEDQTSADTLLRFLTDDALFREALQDPLLERYSVIILDEVHQRTLETDLLIGVLKMVIQRRTELKIVIMAASMDVQTVQGHFDGAPLLSLPNRISSVDIYHSQDSEKDYMKAVIRTVIQIHTSESEGDILVFLTNEEEVDLACQILRKEALYVMTSGELAIRPLYIGLTTADQQKVFDPAPPAKMLGGTGGKPGRKVIVATSVAETSIAIDSIVYVIDLGLAKYRVYNPRTKVECMLVSPISQASASQRSLLAGRTRPGKCFRMYPEKAFKNDLPLVTHPEIMRSNLSMAVLMLKRLGFDDVVHFDFVDPPSPEALMRALESLNHLGFLDDNGNITEAGHQACQLPVEPQLAKMLLESTRHKCSNEALSIAAMLCALPIFVRPNDAFRAANEAKARFAHMDGDHLTLLNVFHAFKQQVQDGQDPTKFCSDNFISLRAVRFAEVAREQLKKAVEGLGLPMASTNFQDKEYYPNIRRCVLSGFFMQTACLQDEKKGLYGTLREGHDYFLHPTTSLQHKPEWIVYHEQAITSKNFVKTVTQIRPEWLLDIAPNYFHPQRISEKHGIRDKLERIVSKLRAV